MGPKVSRSSLNPVEMERISADRSRTAAAEGSERPASRLEAPSNIAIRLLEAGVLEKRRVQSWRTLTKEQQSFLDHDSLLLSHSFL